MASRTELQAQLDQMVEADGDPSEIMALIARIDALGSDQPKAQAKEANVGQMKLTADVLGIPATEPQPKEAPVSKKFELTKELLGVTGRALPEVTEEAIEACFTDVPGWNMIGFGLPSSAILDKEHRLHVELRGEVKLAARGLAIALAGGVQANGFIHSPTGTTHVVKGGVCYELQTLKQLNSFDRSEAVIERTVPCRGHLEYQNVGTPEQPRFKATGHEFGRCQHQWALMFAAGFYVTCARDLPTGGKNKDVAITEIRNRVGDETLRKAAQDQYATWNANAAEKREVRAEYGAAIAAEKAAIGVAPEALLPAVPGALDLVLPSGETLGQAVSKIGGQFRVTIEVPLLGGRSAVQFIRARGLNELVSRMATHIAVAKATGKSVAIKAVEAVQ